MANYATCLAHPFSDEAEGAQVPDMYSLNTITAHITTSFTLSTTDNTGEFDCVIQPNLFATIAAGNGVTSGLTHITGGVFKFSNPSSAGFYEYGITDPSTVENLFARYRVVGWGIQMRVLPNTYTQQGKIMFCKVPSLNQFADYDNSLTPGASWSDYLNYYELPNVDGTTGYLANAILSLPTAGQVSFTDMSLHGGTEVVGSITSPVAFEWRDGSSTPVLTTSGPGPIYQSGQIQLTTGSTPAPPVVFPSIQPVRALDSDYLRQGGWSVLVMKATGLSPTPQAWIDAQIIFHLEGIPRITNSLVMVPSRKPPVHPNFLSAAIAAAHEQPHFRKLNRARASTRQALHAAARFAGYSDASHLLSSIAASGGNIGTAAGYAAEGFAMAGLL